jgi:hypothetical protein
VHFTCADPDNFSGIPAGTCPADQTVSTDTGAGGTLVTAAVSDAAGNSAATSLPIKLDQHGPIVTATPDRAPNAAGWYGGPVTFHFACDDTATGDSGVAGCPSNVTISGDGANQTRTVQATDVAGNTTSYTTPAVNIDAAAPTTVFANASPTTKRNGERIGGQSTDTTSGVAKVVITFTTATGTVDATATTTCPGTPGLACGWGARVPHVLLPTIYTVTAVSTDVVGNTSTSSITLIVIP